MERKSKHANETIWTADMVPSLVDTTFEIFDVCCTASLHKIGAKGFTLDAVPATLSENLRAIRRHAPRKLKQPSKIAIRNV